MQLFDSHCHLDDPRVDIAAAGGAMTAANVHAAVIAGFGPERSSRGQQLCRQDPRLRRAVGLHPWWLAAFDGDLAAAWQHVAAEASSDEVVAIGEIGLDRGRRKAMAADVQRTQMRRGLEIANAAALPVILHIVGWHGHALRELRALPPEAGGVVHRFGGSFDSIAAYLEMGLHLSIDVIAFRRDPATARARALAIGLDRLVVETDWPELGVTYAESLAELRQMIGILAEDRAMSAAELAGVLWRNTCALYRI